MAPDQIGVTQVNPWANWWIFIQSQVNRIEFSSILGGGVGVEVWVGGGGWGLKIKENQGKQYNKSKMQEISLSGS